MYSARNSINDVEAQAGTGWHDTANNKLYVHLFDDTAPPRDGTNLYLTSSGWGTADHQRRLHLAGKPDDRRRHARGPAGQHVGDRHRSQANHLARGHRRTCAAPTRWPKTSTLTTSSPADRPRRNATTRTRPLASGSVGTPTGSGRRWASALEGKTARRGRLCAAPSSIARGTAQESTARNTLEHSRFWAFPTTRSAARAPGSVIRHNVFLNGQDSI